MEKLKLTLFIKDKPKENTDSNNQSKEVVLQNGITTENPSSEEQESEIVICSDNSTEAVLNVNKVNCKLTINNLTFCKRVYQPCEILAVINIIMPLDFKQLLPRDAIVETLKGIRVKLENIRNDGTNRSSEIVEVIAQNYYVHELSTTYYSSGKSVEVCLHIFSQDKKLTLDRFCRAYTAKKLYEDILFADADKMLADNHIVLNTNNSLTFLSYKRTKAAQSNNSNNSQNKEPDESQESEANKNKSADSGDQSIEICEFIQPYLVQYNESYYDFLARTANRCGEFLYFEDGKLCLGLPKQNNAESKTITSFDSITYRDITEGIHSVDDYHHNGMYMVEKSKNSKEYSEAASDYTTSNFAYNFEIPMDDYITIFSKDEFANWESEYIKNWGSKALEWISLVLNYCNKSNKDKIIVYGIKEAVASIKILHDIKKKNEKGNTKNIFDMPPEQRIEESISGINSKGEKAIKGSPFSTLIHPNEVHELFKENLTTLFYKTIKIMETKVSSEAVEVDLGVNFMDLKLGEIVKLNDGKEYIVIEIKGGSKVGKLGTETDYRVLLIPVSKWKVDVNPSQDSNSTSTDSSNKEISYYCPPLCSFPSIRTSSPQLAIVGSSDDPKGFGRIRIRYPWQTKNADMSPWIRLATPFATEGGGVYFSPVVGDEVLIDYDGGNIERPYVVGSLYTGKIKVPNGTRVISSANGHSIVMKDPQGTGDFIGGLWGTWSILQGHISNMEKVIPEGKNIAGGIELKDRYGIYSIKMSSSSREISISSLFGDVKINAFSGISLSAPSGKISLNAKDIEITASNNIAITSGEDLPDVVTDLDKKGIRTKSQMKTGERISSFFKDNVASSIYDSLITRNNLVNFISKYSSDLIWNKILDLKLLRTIIEVFLPPYAGTIRIKSWRYMILEAGRGKAQIPNNGYTVKGVKVSVDSSLANEYQVVREISLFVDEWQKKLCDFYGLIHRQYEPLANCFRQYTKEDANTEWTQETIESKIKTMMTAAVNDTSKKYEKSDFTFKNEGDVNNNQILEVSNDLQKNVKDLIDLVENPSSLFKLYAGLRKSKAMDICIKNIDLPLLFEPFTADLRTKTENFLAMPDTANLLISNKKAKRKLIYLYINESGILYSPDYSGNGDDFDNNENWIGFVNNLTIKEKEKQKQSLWNTVTKVVSDSAHKIAKDNPIYTWNKTHNVWGALKEGEILFSDKDGNTISFANGHLTHVEKVYNIKQILRYI